MKNTPKKAKAAMKGWRKGAINGFLIGIALAVLWFLAPIKYYGNILDVFQSYGKNIFVTYAINTMLMMPFLFAAAGAVIGFIWSEMNKDKERSPKKPEKK